MKRLFLVFGLLWTISVSAEIRNVTHLDDVFRAIRHDSVVLMDIDETLIESSIMLGGKAWRYYAVNFLKTIYSPQEARELRDKMTYWIAQRVPCIAVEASIHAYLDQMKQAQIPVFGFTSRGRRHWNALPCANGEELALLHLNQAGFDLDVFSESFFSEVFWLHPRFARGIFFSYPEEKGQLALEIFTKDRPKHIVFVDDMMPNIHSMERALEELGIASTCFHYQHVDLYRPFDPLIAAIQLDTLYSQHVLLSDSEAFLLKQNYADCNPDTSLLKFIEYLENQEK
jgi:hypothetical protein